MKDFTAELAKLEQDHARKVAELRRTEQVLSALPDAVRALPWRYVTSPLYGTAGLLYVEHDFYRYGDHNADIPQPTIQTVAVMGAAFPGEPLRKIRDGSLSFRPAAYVDGLPEEKKTRWDEETDVAPFTVKITGFQHYTYGVEWAAMIAGELTRVRVTLPLQFMHNGNDNRLGRLEIRYKDIKGGRLIESNTFKPADNLLTLFRGDEPVAQLESPIRWASGSPETPGDHTLYWVALRADDPQPTVTDLVAAIGTPATE